MGTAGAVSSSSIQTILSVPELHRFGAEALADYTAGGEFRPALKNPYELKLHDSMAMDSCQVFVFVLNWTHSNCDLLSSYQRLPLRGAGSAQDRQIN